MYLERTTERLILQPFRDVFLEAYFREFTEEITRYQYPDVFPSLEAANEVLSGFVQEMEQGNMLELVVLAKNGEFLGSMEVFGIREKTPEIGLWLKSSAQGKGYGYEALREMMDYLGQTQKYEYIIYEADLRNTPSIRLAERFHYEKGENERITTDSGKELTMQIYRLFPSPAGKSGMKEENFNG